MDLQILLNKGYVKLFKVDMSEFADVQEYKSLNGLFTRPLAQARRLADGFVSPCDGKISVIGQTYEDKALQVKGFCYSLNELIDDAIENASYVTIYLSPRDYHRFHAPCDLEVERTTFIEGVLLPVNGISTNFFKNLFVRNERVVLKCKTFENKAFYMVYVGALNVGSISLKHTERRSNNKEVSKKEVSEERVTYQKGEEIGAFNMGSTIIIVGDNDALKLEAKKGGRVRFGEKIGTL